MPHRLANRLDRAVERLSIAYPGPGGACAVLREGEVLGRHAWGYANAERRIAFTTRTLFRICSITKQFTCAAALDAFPDLSVLDDEIRVRLPNLEGPIPGALRLAHNQSGLRDYWAVAMLHGSPAEAPFGDAEATQLISATRSLQFAPGARYSYANQNFRLLSDALEDRTGRSFGENLRARVFDPADMASAIVAADTRALPDGGEGYEGSPATGFRAAENRILWTGDAGIAATLDDMIGYERWVDASRDDPDSLYARLSAPVTFADGAPATYGFGLGRGQELGREVTAHGGALRGWRSHRLYAPGERISVVVMFNHLSDARAAAIDLLAAVVDETTAPETARGPTPGWLGAYVEPETSLSARIDLTAEGRVRLRYGQWPDILDIQADGCAAAPGVRLRPDGETLVMERPGENLSTRLQRVADLEPGLGGAELAGVYRCEALQAQLTVVDAGGALYGGFSGHLGQGRMEQLEPIAADLWALPCWRALDHTPPGDWTLRFRRDGSGPPSRVEVGCWLARGLTYTRIA